MQGDETIAGRLELFRKQRTVLETRMAELQQTMDTLDYKCWFYETAAARGSTEGISDLPEMGVVANELYAQSGLGPDAFQTAVLYDHFTPFVLPQLEEFGFCKRGEAKDFIRAGEHARGGKLPINTHGGQLGEAYIHGMNGVAEAVRQVRGTAVNQVADVENVLVTAGTGVPTSGIILGVA